MRDGDGSRLLGGHSLRLAGARLLSSSGMRLYQVELMARWKSPMLLHYAQTAPLTKITAEFTSAKNGNNLDVTLDWIKQQLHHLQQKSDQNPERDRQLNGTPSTNLVH